MKKDKKHIAVSFVNVRLSASHLPVTSPLPCITYGHSNEHIPCYQHLCCYLDGVDSLLESQKNTTGKRPPILSRIPSQQANRRV